MTQLPANLHTHVHNKQLARVEKFLRNTSPILPDFMLVVRGFLHLYQTARYLVLNSPANHNIHVIHVAYTLYIYCDSYCQQFVFILCSALRIA